MRIVAVRGKVREQWGEKDMGPRSGNGGMGEEWGKEEEEKRYGWKEKN